MDELYEEAFDLGYEAWMLEFLADNMGRYWQEGWMKAGLDHG